MGMTLEIEGLNLERLLRTAAAAGLVLGDVQRVDVRAVRVRLPVWKRKRLLALCGGRFAKYPRECFFVQRGWCANGVRWAWQRRCLWASCMPPPRWCGRSGLRMRGKT